MLPIILIALTCYNLLFGVYKDDIHVACLAHSLLLTMNFFHHVRHPKRIHKNSKIFCWLQVSELPDRNYFPTELDVVALVTHFVAGYNLIMKVFYFLNKRADVILFSIFAIMVELSLIKNIYALRSFQIEFICFPVSILIFALENQNICSSYF